MKVPYKSIYQHAIRLNGSVEDFPFGPEVHVFKVCGKMFMLMAAEEKPARITLKCEPDDVVQLCDQYSSVSPGYYMNKKHWITIVLDNELPASLIISLLDDSYNLVVKKLTKKDRENLVN